jgi:hypothetical protein
MPRRSAYRWARRSDEAAQIHGMEGTGFCAIRGVRLKTRGVRLKTCQRLISRQAGRRHPRRAHADIQA